MSFCQHVTPGKTDAPVELRDILPTFLDAADVTIPTDMDGRSLLPLAKGMETNWRKYLDLEHATCYSDDNYWCALTDGKIKYIWRIHTGTEELFDLTQDPQELHNAVNDKKYRKQLTEMRNEMIRHLSERGEEFVKDGRLVVKEKTMLYGPHYPEKENKDNVCCTEESFPIDPLSYNRVYNSVATAITSLTSYE